MPATSTDAPVVPRAERWIRAQASNRPAVTVSNSVIRSSAVQVSACACAVHVPTGLPLTLRGKPAAACAGHASASGRVTVNAEPACGASAFQVPEIVTIDVT